MRPSSDASILDQLIGLHFAAPPVVLDATWGRGVIWRGSAYQPTTRFDLRPMPGVDVVGEWRELPQLFGTGAFQLVVWDPPHQTDGGERAFSKGTWSMAYGTAARELRGHHNITHLYAGFLEAARQVLRADGVLLAKIADMVHASVQQLQAVDLVVAARQAGWTVCEMVPKMRQPTPTDPRWRRQMHVRKAWSYWICAHPGPRCTSIGVALLRSCAACGRGFPARRGDAKTCGGACRERLRYHQNLTDSRGVAQKLSVRTRV
jgi:hypothetical protein